MDRFFEALNKGEAINRMMDSIMPDETADILEKGKKLPPGAIRTHGGVEKQKHPDGTWRPVPKLKAKKVAGFDLEANIKTEDLFYKDNKWNARRVQERWLPIIKEYADKAVESKDPTVTLMMGAPATGKGYLISHLEKIGQGLGSLVVDPDEIKTQKLKEEFQFYSSFDIPHAAERVHGEGSAISKSVVSVLSEMKADFIQDRVFHELSKLTQEIDKFKKLGYKVKIVMSSANKQESYERMVQRGEKTGRFVPIEFFDEAHDTIETTFSDFMKNIPDNVVSVRKFDTNTNPPKEIVNYNKEDEQN